MQAGLNVACTAPTASMANKSIASRILVPAGTGSIAAVLFWMALYLAGPEALFAGVIALAAAIAWLTRRGIDSTWTLTERLFIACLVAAQASLLSAALLEVVPVVLDRAL